MFTGIIKELGEISSVEKQKDGVLYKIDCKNILRNKEVGQSIAVDGTCVTIVSLSSSAFSFLSMPETLSHTIMKSYKKGTLVNLEPALSINDSLDGHLVQGHIDCLGKVYSTNLRQDDKKKRLQITYPESISQYLAFKGSITINGISLTISDLKEKYLQVDLIPHTISTTNLQFLKENDPVNIEVDLMARYLHRMLQSKEKETKFEFLKERGFI